MRRVLALPLVLAALALTGCSPDYVMPADQRSRPVSVDAQLAYVERHWQEPNTAEWGDLGGTDCVNFTSQSLHARGWPMTEEWGSVRVDGRNTYAPAWVSSTAMRDWLATQPDLAQAVDDDARNRLAVGDVAQFDWDRSGDRDHTVVVTGVRQTASGTEVLVTGHSPAYRDKPVDELLEEHPGAAVHYWHLLR